MHKVGCTCRFDEMVNGMHTKCTNLAPYVPLATHTPLQCKYTQCNNNNKMIACICDAYTSTATAAHAYTSQDKTLNKNWTLTSTQIQMHLLCRRVRKIRRKKEWKKTRADRRHKCSDVRAWQREQQWHNGWVFCVCLNNRIFNKLNLIYKTEGKKSCKRIELFRWQCKWVDQAANNAMPLAWMKRTFFSSNAFNSYVFDGNVRNFTSPNWNWNLDMIIAVVVIQIEFQFNLHRRQRGRNALNSFHFQLIQLKWIRTKCDCGTGIVIQECDIIVYLCGNE